MSGALFWDLASPEERIRGQLLRSEELAQGFNGLGVRNVMVGVFSSIEQEMQLASRASSFGSSSS